MCVCEGGGGGRGYISRGIYTQICGVFKTFNEGLDEYFLGYEETVAIFSGFHKPVGLLTSGSGGGKMEKIEGQNLF